MAYFAARLMQQLKEKQMTKYRLAKLSGVSESVLIKISNNQRRATDDVLRKIAAVPDFGVNYDTLCGWRALDELSDDALLAAFRERFTEIPDAFSALLSQYPDPQDQVILWLIHTVGPDAFGKVLEELS